MKIVDVQGDLIDDNLQEDRDAALCYQNFNMALVLQKSQTQSDNRPRKQRELEGKK
jgi:hypothetical protein